MTENSLPKTIPIISIDPLASATLFLFEHRPLEHFRPSRLNPLKTPVFSLPTSRAPLTFLPPSPPPPSLPLPLLPPSVGGPLFLPLLSIRPADGASQRSFQGTGHKCLPFQFSPTAPLDSRLRHRTGRAALSTPLHWALDSAVLSAYSLRCS